MGLIHLDAGLIIGFLDGDDAHHDASRAALSDALGRGDRLAIAASALAACLVGPARRSPEAIDLVRTVIWSTARVGCGPQRRNRDPWARVCDDIWASRVG